MMYSNPNENDHQNQQPTSPCIPLLIIIGAFFFLGIPDFGFILTILLGISGVCLLIPYITQKQRQNQQYMRVPYAPVIVNVNNNPTQNLSNNISPQYQTENHYASQQPQFQQKPSVDLGFDVEEKYCESCGKELNPDARFCDGCGKKLN